MMKLKKNQLKKHKKQYEATLINLSDMRPKL